jgi:signal transduction histidine kinase
VAINNWYARIIEPRSSDEDDRRRERVLNIILVSSIAMLVLFDALILYYSLREGAAYRDMPFDTFSIIPAGFILLYVLSRRSFFVAASYILVAVYFISISYAAYRWGVDLPAALLSYAILVAIASILINARFGFIMASIISGFMIVVWHFQFYGILSMDQSSRNNSDALVFAILLFLLTIVSWLSNREIERSLARARKSEQNLEAKVAERTQELEAVQLEKIDHLYRFAEFGQLASGLFHDLLNVVNAAALHDEKTVNQARTIQTEIDRFRTTFQNQLSRDTTLQLFSLRQSIEDIIQLLAYQAKHAGAHISFAAADSHDMFEYFGSSLKFHQIMLNVVLNAIESFDAVATRSNRSVVISLDRKANEIVLHIADNGPGISDDLKQKIFEPFFTTKDNLKKGTGIGLAITKQIVEEDFSGSISVEDGPDGIGSVFIIKFHESPRATKHDETVYRGHQERSAS